MPRSRHLLPALLILASLLAAALLRPAPAAGQVSLDGPAAIRDIRAQVSPSPVQPNQSFTLTVDLTVEPGMHIQAAKPLQDYLIGTDLAPDPVDGITWGQPRYPAPHERVDPTLGTLAEYAGSLRIELPGTVQPDATPGPRAISLTLRYQACTDQGTCYPPQTVPIQATLEIAPASAGSATPPAATPPAAPGNLPASASPSKQSPGSRLPWQPFTAQRLADLTSTGKTVLIDFTADWCPNCKLNERIALNTPRTAELVSRNDVVPLVADFTHPNPEVRAWLAKFHSISVPLTVLIPGNQPTAPILLRDTYLQASLLRALAQAGPSLSLAQPRLPLTLDTPITIAEPTGSTAWYLLAAFLGGFILNFMPCVLPVISIKILSLLGQAGQSHRRVFGLGLAFSAGMLALFLTLGILVIVAGQTWGALFQSATFLVVMLSIVVAMACSLFGAFTLSVPSAIGNADAAIEGEGYIGSFGKGVFAVLLGTPCSGPLLGSVLTWSVSVAAAGQRELALLVFVAMGLGMASPFLVLAAKPGWMRYLPKPGPWMETFKQLMGFLLLLTAVYIVSLLADLAIPALLFSIGIAFAAWLYGKWVTPLRPPAANWLARGLIAALVAALAWASFKI